MQFNPPAAAVIGSGDTSTVMGGFDSVRKLEQVVEGKGLMRVLTAAEMREVDRGTISLGISDVVLMENAGTAWWSFWPSDPRRWNGRGS